MEVQRTAVETDRILTIPNILSALRLVGIPVFLWLVLAVEADGWAIAVLMLSGATDYVDGVLARRWHQISRLGRLLDPLADRLFIVSTIVALTLREIIPVWFTIALLARDLFVFALVPVSKRLLGVTALPVHFLGKAATFCLLIGFPLLLISDGSGTFALLGGVFGWALVVWGAALYWWAAVLYTVQAWRLWRGDGS